MTSDVNIDKFYGMSKFGSFIKKYTPIGWQFSLFKNLFKGVSDFSISNGVSSLLNKVTGAGLTGAEKEANAFTAQQTQAQMDFQERMSNTAYQRQVTDMQNAGVNPALMYGNGASGASTPSGASGTSVSPSASDIVGLLGQIQNMYLLKAQRKNIEAQTKEREKNVQVMESAIKSNLANIEVMRANANKIGLEGDALAIANSYLDREKSLQLEYQQLGIDKASAEIDEINAKVEKLSNENKKLLQEISESQQRVNVLLAQEKLTDAERGEVYSRIQNINQSTDNLVKQGVLTQKEINWYTHDKIAGDVGTVINGASNILGNVLGFKKLGALVGRSGGRVDLSGYGAYGSYD